MKLFKVVFSLLLLTFVVTNAQNVKEYEKSFSVDSDAKLSIDTYKGTITIDTWDKNDIAVYAKVEADEGGWFGTDPEDQLERCRVIFEQSGNVVTVKSDYEKQNNSGSNTLALVHYSIKMPADVKLEVDDYKSESSITGINSSIDFETYKGEVKIYDLAGDIDLETYKGEIRVDFDAIKGDCDFETYKGEITLVLNSSAKFDCDFELGRKGDYSSEFELDIKKLDRDDGEVRGKVNGGGPRIEFSTYKGEIKLKKK